MPSFSCWQAEKIKRIRFEPWREVLWLPGLDWSPWRRSLPSDPLTDSLWVWFQGQSYSLATPEGQQSLQPITEKNDLRIEPNKLADIFFPQSTLRCSAHPGLPYGSWSNSWQHQFQCCQCSTRLFCRPPVGIPSHITGTQWNRQGLELWQEKNSLVEFKDFFFFLNNNLKTDKAKE